MTDEPKRKPQLGDADYVGYCSPPVSGQFKKGQSGNPGGKPKKAVVESDQTIYEREMNRKRTVLIEGKRRRMTNRELFYKQTIEQALRQDPKATPAIMRAEEKYGHLRAPQPKVDGGGVLVVGPYMDQDTWVKVYGGPKTLPPFPILDDLRAQLMKKPGDDDDKA